MSEVCPAKSGIVVHSTGRRGQLATAQGTEEACQFHINEPEPHRIPHVSRSSRTRHVPLRGGGTALLKVRRIPKP